MIIDTLAEVIYDEHDLPSDLPFSMLSKLFAPGGFPLTEKVIRHWGRAFSSISWGGGQRSQ
jgi:hypothetical protein